MFDYIIKNANLYLGNGRIKTDTDMAVKEGKIILTEPGINSERAENCIFAEGKLIVPGFMDTHMHIDKAFTMKDDATLSLIEACANSERQSASYFDWTEEQIYNEIMEHSRQVAKLCVIHGTTLLKTNVLFSSFWKTIALRAMNDLKKEFQDYLDIKTCVSFPEEYRKELERAAKEGRIDCIGGYPHLAPDYKAVTEDCFQLAVKYGLPLDLHCDEADVTNLDCFRYIIECTEKYGMQGKVTCGHVTALNAANLSEEEAEELIEKAAKVKMNVTSLTSCNMYLMNMTGRGPTRVRQLTEAGVNVSIASDNVRDTFRPFGNCNLIEEALLTAQIHKFGNREWLRSTMDMITYHPAINVPAEDYGLNVGCRADFCMLDALSPEEAIISRAKCLLVFKNGRITVKNGMMI